MAASAFTVFTEAKDALGKGSINLNGDNFRLILLQSGTAGLSENAPHSTITSGSAAGWVRFGDLGSYSQSGRLLVNVSWRTSGNKKLFDATDWSLSANGVTYSKILAALIIRSGGRPIAYASLSTATFDLAAGNKLIVQFHASGIFTLV